MAKVYLVRHQKAGILTGHVFTEPPTLEQMAPLVAAAERLHGKEGWARVHEAELYGPGEIPELPTRPEVVAGGAGEAAADLFRGSGSGTVG